MKRDLYVVQQTWTEAETRQRNRTVQRCERKAEAEQMLWSTLCLRITVLSHREHILLLIFVWFNHFAWSRFFNKPDWRTRRGFGSSANNQLFPEWGLFWWRVIFCFLWPVWPAATFCFDWDSGYDPSDGCGDNTWWISETVQWRWIPGCYLWVRATS